MTKILLDPIYTGRVHKCASTVKFVRLAEALLQDPNVFIYWSLPDWIDEEGLNWLPTSERIHYFRLEQSKDRYKEYRRISYERECMFSYQGDFWDWDICVTNRTSKNHHADTVLETSFDKLLGYFFGNRQATRLQVLGFH